MRRKKKRGKGLLSGVPLYYYYLAAVLGASRTKLSTQNKTRTKSNTNTKAFKLGKNVIEMMHIPLLC